MEQPHLEEACGNEIPSSVGGQPQLSRQAVRRCGLAGRWQAAGGGRCRDTVYIGSHEVIANRSKVVEQSKENDPVTHSVVWNDPQLMDMVCFTMSLAV